MSPFLFLDDVVTQQTQQTEHQKSVSREFPLLSVADKKILPCFKNLNEYSKY